VTLRLIAIETDADVDSLAARLAPGFGGDEAGARDVLHETIALLSTDPRPAPWGSYLAHDGDAIVGICAFKAAPDAEGIVEIAYMTFPAFEGRGHAGAMIAALTDIARDGGASLPIAHTLPVENASNRALRRNGYVFAGETIDPEDGVVWRWERRSGGPTGERETQ
jgi:RimJ/RimL family protein N-acetyltransferase